jgi:hypothetical protein
MDSNNRSDREAWLRGTAEVEAVFARLEADQKRRTQSMESVPAVQDDSQTSSITPAQIREAARQGIFMSYARTDEIFALELAVRLVKDDFSVWLDMVDGGNKDWTQEIFDAMRVCGLMIAVVSPLAMNDMATTAERQRFVDMGKLVLPVLRRAYPLDAISRWLSPVDFTPGFNHGLVELRQLLVGMASTV